MNHTTNEIINKGIQAEVSKPPVRERIADWISEQGGWTLLFVAFMLAMLIGITLWEATNSAKGWVKLMSGAVPEWLVFAGAFFLPIGYVGFHRRAMERWRDGLHGQGIKAATVALLAMVASLFGVFANIASETEKSAEDALKNNNARASLYAEIKTLEFETSDDRLIEERAMLEVTTRWIASVEAEAVGWGMEKVPVPGGADGEMTVATPEQCAGDLRTRQRTICNRLNGDGADEFGLRNDLFKTNLNIAEIERKRGVLEEKRALYDSMQYQDGAAHWGAMERIASGKAESDFIRVWGALGIAIVLLLIAGFGWDEFFERTEKEIGVDIL